MIGSPDIDIMFSNTLPNLEIAKAYYQVDFEKFAIVTSSNPEASEMEQYTDDFVNGLLADDHNYIVVYNDLGVNILFRLTND
jgi:UDP-N-acetylglucosamine 2-epimerase (hydrolysing)